MHSKAQFGREYFDCKDQTVPWNAWKKKLYIYIYIYIYIYKLYILNNSAIWLVNTKPQYKQCIEDFHLEERASHVVIQ